MPRKKNRSGLSAAVLQRVVSGGQTGVDQAGLDAALEMDLPIGGWCPQGRRSEDGRIPDRFPLQETPERSYSVRTEQNVRDSDGTLIIVMNQVSGGTLLTLRIARRLQKPAFVVHLRPEPDNSMFSDRNSLREQIDSVVDWLIDNRISVLNVAGPRASSAPAIYDEARSFITAVLQRLSGPA